MKNIIYKLLFLISVITISSCYSDKGNYDYNYGKEIDLSSYLKSVAIPTVMYSEEFELEVSIPEDVAKLYNFWWEDAETDTTMVVFEGLNLKISAYKVGAINLRLVAEEKSTGILTMRDLSPITVTQQFEQGWLLLCNDEGTTGLSFITPLSKKTLIKEELNDYGYWEREYSYERLGWDADYLFNTNIPSTSSAFFMSYDDSFDFSTYESTDASFLWIDEGDEANAYEHISFEHIMKMNDNIVGGYPAGFDLKGLYNSNQGSLLYSADGKVYPKMNYSSEDSKNFEKFAGYPLSYKGDVVTFHDIFAINYGHKAYQDDKLMFHGELADGVQKILFLTFSSNLPLVKELEDIRYTDPNEEVDILNFGDWELVDGVFNQISMDKTTNLIFKRGSDYRMLNISPEGGEEIIDWETWEIYTTPEYYDVEGKDFSGGAYMKDNTEFIAVDGTFYFSSGNQVYRYNFDTNTTTLFYTFAAGGDIVGFDTNFQKTELAVATEGGHVAILNIERSFTGVEIEKKLFTDFGSIQQITYKYRSKEAAGASAHSNETWD